MLRTNSKAAKENIRAYITEYALDALEGYDVEPETIDEMMFAIMQIFREEKKHDLTRSRFINEYEIFKDWAQGLAMGGLFCYYYNREAVTDLGDILEETESERSKYSERDAEELLTKFIYREVVKGSERVSF